MEDPDQIVCSCCEPSDDDHVNTSSDLTFAKQTKHSSNSLERAYAESVINSFHQYATFARFARDGQTRRVLALHPAQKRFLPPSLLPGTPEYKERELMIQHAEIQNQFFFDIMLRHGGIPTSQDVRAEALNEGSECKWSNDEHMSKVSSVFKSLARDWSLEGASERDESYGPILNGFNHYLPIKKGAPHNIVVPGAGLGRLALELSSKGYAVEGNEFSLQMLFASDFLLNGGITPQKPLLISPWLLENRNVCSISDKCRNVSIPDVDPSAMLDSSNSHDNGEESSRPNFSMAAGDFVSIYSSPHHQHKWKGVASCFFLDTAPCVVEYLHVIHGMLDVGGFLINFGPLHFHWSGPPFRPDDESDENYIAKHSHMDSRYLKSVDMSWQDVKEVLLRIGFELLEEQLFLPAQYTADSKSFMRTQYQCIFFVAKKVSRK